MKQSELYRLQLSSNKLVLTFLSDKSSKRFAQQMDLALQRNEFHTAYRLESELGSGTFGAVFTARRRDGDSKVAVKVAKVTASNAAFAKEVAALKSCEGCLYISQMLESFDLMEEGARRYIVLEQAVRCINSASALSLKSAD